MRRYLTLALLLAVPWPALAQTTVRIKDANGKVVVELFVAAPGSVEVLPGPPGPGPAPQPEPPPNPVPPPNPLPPPAPVPPVPPNPAPVAGPVLHVVIISDTTAGAMTPAQFAALSDSALRVQLKAKKLEYHNFDVKSAAVQQLPPTGLNYKKWLAGGANAVPGVGTTALLLLDAKGRLAKGMPLPADAASILAAVNTATGG